MTGTRRPYKVTFHYDAGGITPAGTVRKLAINEIQSSHALYKVRNTARTVSRNGGAAIVWTRDPMTGEKVTLRTYRPFEIALEDLIGEVFDEWAQGLR